jgi:hypothetical protein
MKFLTLLVRSVSKLSSRTGVFSPKGGQMTSYAVDLQRLDSVPLAVIRVRRAR